MGVLAVHAINRSGVGRPPCHGPYINGLPYMRTFSWADFDAHVDAAAPPCVLHLVRNPFELIVSSYVYDRRGAEHWASTPFHAHRTHEKWGLPYLHAAR